MNTGTKPVGGWGTHPSDRPYAKKPTKKQLDYMKDLGINYDPKRISRKLAVILINRKLTELKTNK